MFKDKLQTALPDQVKELRLFGSKARGEASKFSDIDMMITLPERSWPTRKIVHRLASEVFWATDVDLSVKIITPDIGQRLRSIGSPLMTNIDREGISI